MELPAEDPAAYRARLPTAVGAVTVTLKEMAWAVAGMPQRPARLNVRVSLADRAGPANGPAGVVRDQGLDQDVDRPGVAHRRLALGITLAVGVQHA